MSPDPNIMESVCGHMKSLSQTESTVELWQVLQDA